MSGSYGLPVLGSIGRRPAVDPACRLRHNEPPVLLLAVVLWLMPPVIGASAPGGSQAASGSAATTIQAFLASLRQAVATDRRPEVAALMRFPLEVRVGGLQVPVRDTAAFMELYGTIFTPALKDVVARARVPVSGTAPGLLRTPEGGVIIDNTLTVAPRGGSFAVTAITVPLAPPPTVPSGRQAAARPLTFRVGRPTEVAGTLLPGGRDTYTFHAQQGTFIEARLSGIPGRTVLLRLVNDATATAVDARADTGTRVWIGRVPAAATYRVEVLRQADTGTEPLLYTLSVALK